MGFLTDVEKGEVETDTVLPVITFCLSLAYFLVDGIVCCGYFKIQTEGKIEDG